MRCTVAIAIIVVASSVAARAQSPSLQEQGICAAQARKTFQEDSYKWDLEQKQMNLGMTTISFDYQSHYNAKINRCLILTTRMSTFGGETSTAKNLYDAFERRDYASYLWTSRAGKKILGGCAIALRIGHDLWTNENL